MIIHDGGRVMLAGSNGARILLLDSLNNLFNITCVIDFLRNLLFFLTFRLFLTWRSSDLLFLGDSIVRGHLLLILFGLLDGVGILARFSNINLLCLSRFLWWTLRYNGVFLRRLVLRGVQKVGILLFFLLLSFRNFFFGINLRGFTHCLILVQCIWVLGLLLFDFGSG